MNIVLRYAARSDVGLVRAENQDSGYAGPDLLVVADGMGGHAGGDVASSIAIAALVHLDGTAHDPDQAGTELDEAIDAARRTIIDRSAAEPQLTGMGTTVTAILRAGTSLVMAHLGDSRAYLLRDDELSQVTTDHTFVQHLVDTGRIAPEDAEHHPQRNVVMRVLGDFEVDLTPDLSVREARHGDRWLLCSDGLSGFVSAETIAQILISVTDPGECAETLVQLALRAGSTDNVTCVVADVVDTDVEQATAGAAEGSPVLAPQTDPQVVGSAIEDPVALAAIVAATSARRGDTAALPVVPADGAVPSDTTEAPDASAGTVAGSVVAGGPQATDHDLVDADETDPEADETDADGADGADGAEEAPERRHRRGIRVVGTLVAVLAVLGIGYSAYGWTQDQFYVGVSDGQVAVFQGVPQRVGPLALSSPVELTGTQVGALPSYVQDRLRASIPASSLTDARSRASDLTASTMPTPAPTLTPTLAPTTPAAPPTTPPATAPPTTPPTQTPAHRPTPRTTHGPVTRGGSR